MRISRKEWCLIICTLVYVEIFGGLLILNFPKHKVEVIAAMIGLLSVVSTGYGAYLGAKIAGDNATKLMKDQMLITEFSQKSKYDIEFLTQFHEFIMDYNLYCPLTKHNFNTQLYNYINSKDKINELYVDDTTQLIRYPFEAFRSSFNFFTFELDILITDLNRSIDKFVDSKINVDLKDYYIHSTGFSFKALTQLIQNPHKAYKLHYTIYRISENNEHEIYKEEWIKIDVIELYKFITKDNEESMNRMIKSSKKLNDNFLLLKFKSPADLSSYVLKNYYL